MLRNGRGTVSRVRSVAESFRPDPLTIALNGQQRQVRTWAQPIVLLAGAPAVVVVAAAMFVVMAAMVVALFGVLLALPAMLVGWLLSKPTSEPKAAGPERPEVAHKQESSPVRDVTGERER